MMVRSCKGVVAGTRCWCASDQGSKRVRTGSACRPSPDLHSTLLSYLNIILISFSGHRRSTTCISSVFSKARSMISTPTSLQPSTFLSRATGMANNLVSDSRPPPSNVEYKRQTWWSTNEMPCMPCPQGRDGSAPTVGLWVPSTSFIEKHLRSKTPLWAS